MCIGRVFETKYSPSALRCIEPAGVEVFNPVVLDCVDGVVGRNARSSPGRAKRSIAVRVLEAIPFQRRVSRLVGHWEDMPLGPYQAGNTSVFQDLGAEERRGWYVAHFCDVFRIGHILRI